MFCHLWNQIRSIEFAYKVHRHEKADEKAAVAEKKLFLATREEAAVDSMDLDGWRKCQISNQVRGAPRQKDRPRDRRTPTRNLVSPSAAFGLDESDDTDLDKVTIVLRLIEVQEFPKKKYQKCIKIPSSFNRTCIHQFRGEVWGFHWGCGAKGCRVKKRGKKKIGRRFGWKGEWENFLAEV
ncbi:hypothetical protein BSKO_08381 [Bryopsis sp. KO-2023]|nr:hypothetical protein BSKO_08381 [Bryopsis sp. KO-2023]